MGLPLWQVWKKDCQSCQGRERSYDPSLIRFEGGTVRSETVEVLKAAEVAIQEATAQTEEIEEMRRERSGEIKRPDPRRVTDPERIQTA